MTVKCEWYTFFNFVNCEPLCVKAVFNLWIEGFVFNSTLLVPVLFYCVEVLTNLCYWHSVPCLFCNDVYAFEATVILNVGDYIVITQNKNSLLPSTNMKLFWKHPVLFQRVLLMNFSNNVPNWKKKQTNKYVDLIWFFIQRIQFVGE